jgi:hypothetical protein
MSGSNAAEQLLPDHYKAGKMDVIDFCQHHDINFSRGNVIKYVTRAGKKKSDNPNKELEDLKKAMVYLEREIEMLEPKKKLSDVIDLQSINKRREENKLPPLTSEDIDSGLLYKANK